MPTSETSAACPPLVPRFPKSDRDVLARTLLFEMLTIDSLPFAARAAWSRNQRGLLGSQGYKR